MEKAAFKTHFLQINFLFLALQNLQEHPESQIKVLRLSS
jgi:hypothetical protein